MVRDASPPSQERVRGASLGLPAAGPGSLASFQTRVGAFLIDGIGSAFVAALFTAPDLPGNWSLVVFVAITILALLVVGQTPGMRLLGLRLAHPRQGGAAGAVAGRRPDRAAVSARAGPRRRRRRPGTARPADRHCRRPREVKLREAVTGE
jgi:hypothetical protein